MMEPKIRLKGFKGEWETRRIGDIASFSKGNGYSKADLCNEGNPIILYGRMYTKYTTSIEDVDTFAIPKDGSVFSKGGEVIIPASGETPEDISVASSVMRKGVILGGDLNVLSFNSKITEPSFMALAITYSKTHNELSGYAQGKTVVHLHNGNIANGHVSYPDIEEQKSIVEYVKSLDSQISASASRLASLKQVKTASLQAMFPQEGETVPRIRFKGFEGEWKKVQIGDLGNTYSGLTGKGKSDFGIGKSHFITFLNVLTNAKIDTSILESVDVKEGEKQNAVKRGDLFFNTSSETPEEVGMCAVLDEDVENVYLNSFCFGFRLTNTNIYPSFIAYLMRCHIGRNIMSVLAQGATRYNLSKTNFCNTMIIIPSDIQEQQKIADYFTNLDKQITLQAQRLEKLKQIKAACLDKMFV